MGTCPGEEDYTAETDLSKNDYYLSLAAEDRVRFVTRNADDNVGLNLACICTSLTI